MTPFAASHISEVTGCDGIAVAYWSTTRSVVTQHDRKSYPSVFEAGYNNVPCRGVGRVRSRCRYPDLQSSVPEDFVTVRNGDRESVPRTCDRRVSTPSREDDRGRSRDYRPRCI